MRPNILHADSTRLLPLTSAVIKFRARLAEGWMSITIGLSDCPADLRYGYRPKSCVLFLNGKSQFFTNDYSGAGGAVNFGSCKYLPVRGRDQAGRAEMQGIVSGRGKRLAVEHRSHVRV
jgi:hypothetical protein